MATNATLTTLGGERVLVLSTAVTVWFKKYNCGLWSGWPDWTRKYVKLMVIMPKMICWYACTNYIRVGLDCTSVSIFMLNHLCCGKCADYIIFVWICCCRIDVVINFGKSRKNVDAFVLLPPYTRLTIDLFIRTCDLDHILKICAYFEVYRPLRFWYIRS